MSLCVFGVVGSSPEHDRIYDYFGVLFGWLCSAMIILAIIADVYFVHWHVVDFIIALASWFVNSLSSACNIFGFCDFT